VSPSIKVVGKYHGANTRIEVECGLCGQRWNPTPVSLLHTKSGCPNCYHGSTSIMEQFIYWSFVHALGEDAVLSRDRSLGMEVDIHVPDLGLGIEPGSWYWHERKLDEDEAKRAACSAAGVRLVTIYDQCPLEDPPFVTDCLVFRYSLAAERDMTTLKEIVLDLLDEYNIDVDFEVGDWKAIEKRARRSSRRMTTREFINKISLISPSVEVLSDYIGTKERIHCRCKNCGNEWSTAAGNLLNQGTKCPSCAHRKKAIDRIPVMVNADAFHEKLANVSPKIEVVEPYEGLNERVKVRCLACGKEWTAMPRVLLAGSGCPSCKDELRREEAQSQNLERIEGERRSLVAELGMKTQTIEILGEFRGVRRFVTARCLKCGFTWRTMPSKLLKTHRCPSCERSQARSRLKTDEQFREEAAEKNPDIEVIGTYRGVHQPIEVRCKKCGRQWNSTPGRVLKGAGCGPCNMKGPRKTMEQFQDEVAAVNDKILVKGEYRGAVEKVLVECRICGHEWETAASHLLSGTGCPECAKVKQGATNRKSHQQFVDEIAALSPSVEVLGIYKRKSSRIKCRCRECGYEWMTSGQSLLQGSGCPACARRMSSEKQKGIPVTRRIRKVRCVETGEVFRSATAASHSLGLSDPCVNNAAKKGGTAAGFHWEYVDGR
ncbi:MAG: zinc-ribbon domain-containing protein, partial [Oscillospiraceae bacterium]|nr:zinc-ribbon domain-containing protein [Oscillospiraceae bacterium]